jgi:hypothetical protein
MRQQIENLKTELLEFIKLSRTITQGKWKHSPGRRMLISVDSLHEDSVLHGDDFEISDYDATFIARSRNISPAMAECLLMAVETLEQYSEYDALRLKGLQQILNIWEASK